MWTIALVLCTLSIVLLCRRYKMRHLLSAQKMFPGPYALPLLGNAIQAIGSSEDFYQKMLIYADYYKQSYRLWLGNNLYIMILDHKEAEAIMGNTTHTDKAVEYKFLLPWIGDGLLVSSGHKWKKHRKMLTPAFHFKILDKFIEVFNKNGDILCEKLSHKSDGKVFDVYEYIKLYALDNICETAMGTNINAQKYPDSEYVHAVKDLCCTVFKKWITIWLRLEFVFYLSKYGAMQRKALKIIHNMTLDVIRKRKIEFHQSKLRETSGQDENLNIKERSAFLDILLKSAEEYQLSDEDIRAEVDTFMFEGHDTITSGISFTLYLLSEHRDVQEKVFKELNDIFQKDNRSSTFRDLNDMKYLEQVIKESLRLYPSVVFIGRSITENIHLREGVFIPKGAQAMITIGSLHRNPEIWNNPHRFNPENFTPEAIQKRHPFAYVPFSAGPRNCIGQRFAMLEMKSVISKIVRRFEILPSPEESDKPRVIPELILNSENGIRIKLATRRLTEVDAA